ncbi:hypothetical protein DICPUDRAFT_92307 [Dictyostelium purpureum]|uniref:NmrA-like family domain-containing protein 1 n=1 Tax=Dictyostelium purpureum TaxID=5786 RepID=F0ZPZ2_DICPU|nr:uncharacterized protein DICPUDRAFT_92307 [Dictyostelium purpureum]EGC33991.1 hypothetical protein DICPUDRAFT_92307 [Dictyostelium purpureum]|eukprot:XP_003289477.1 hypothetical protein DICPUDRAFT_92307 [Dictyostelium purpureum]
MSKIISVFGATGAQGGSVARALLKDGKFKVRALTRDPNSDSSKKLKAEGCEVVKCDVVDSKQDIEAAIKGSYGVFLVTAFWNYFTKEKEYGNKVADACFDAGVEHLVFSSLSACKKISNGRIDVPHFDLKAEIEDHIRELSKKKPQFISSFVYAPFYMQNIGDGFKVEKSADGNSYTISLPADPSSKFPLDMGDINDIGPVVSGIFNNPSKYSGVDVPFSGSALTGEEIAKSISKATGKQVKFNYIPTKVFATFGFPGAGELAHMFDFYNEFGAFHTLDKSLGSKITKLTTFDEYLQKNPLKLN